MKAFDDLNQLGRNLMEKSLNNPTAPLNSALQQTTALPSSIEVQKNMSLNELQQFKTQTSLTSDTSSSKPVASEDLASKTFGALNSLFVQLESIKPSSVQPFSLYEKNNVKVVLYFGRDQPVADIHVIVVSVTSSNTNSSLKNFSLQAAVPKVCIVFFNFIE
jgi:hypothetical protein